jgi:predicted nuclease of predicted toxin-antitoxin system
MKIKLDENIPARLVNILSQFGHEIDTVPQEGLIGYKDHRVWEAAQNSKSFFITQDLDFSNTERFKPGNHFGTRPSATQSGSPSSRSRKRSPRKANQESLSR